MLEGRVKSQLATLRGLLSRILMSNVLLVMVGGALGTLLRYSLGRWINSQPWAQSGFPYGTFAINVSGSFVLGMVALVILERLPPEQQHWYMLLGTGLCGGYTTFSTFELETFLLVRDGSWLLALVYVVGSVLSGFVALVVGVMLMHLLMPRL